MSTKKTFPSSNGVHQSAVNSEAPIPKKFTLSCAVKESHGHPIYCVAFSRHVHEMDECRVACFATCGGPYATIYEIVTSTKDDKEINRSSKSQPPLTVRQVYLDVDDGETFYTCAFGGRGAGSPVGHSDVENMEVKGNGHIGTGNSNVIHFGDDKRPQQKNNQHNSKRPAKRQKQSEVQTHTQQQHIKSSNSAYFLPYSASQNGPPLLCLGGTRGVIKVIDTNRRCLFLALSGHGNDITDLKFSPANEWLLLSSSKDETVRLWNLQRGVNVATFSGHNGHRGQVLNVSWHMSGTKFASCGMDNMVKLWKVLDDNKETGKNGPVETALRKSFNATPDDWNEQAGISQEACSTNKFEVVIQQFPYFSTNKVHINYVDCVQFIGDLILSKSTSNKVVLWKPLINNEEGNESIFYSTHRVPSSIQFLREFQLEHCNSWYVRFECPPPHHTLLALGNQIGEVKVWHVGENEEEKGGRRPNQNYVCNLTTSGWFGGGAAASTDQSPVRMVAFNPHGSHLVAVRDDSTVWMWDAL
mmetsp:Transcript_39246/g.94463  ORF Transcript_39246/g.94463 Transcript_39246/m.94463 type:complete len:528 (+) Transcript_39246:248-1831(+)